MPEGAAVVVTLAIGATVTLSDISHDGWTTGTAALSTFLALAIVGAALAYRGHQADRRLVVACGLVLVSLSPTVFAYPLNVVVLAFAAWELVRGIGAARGRRRTSDA